MAIRYVDRSRVLAQQSCPRKRYWQYEHQGRGIQPIRMSIPLVVGQMVHRGLEVILSAYQEVQTLPDKCSDNVTDAAVTVALLEYDKEVKARGFTLDPEEEAFSVYAEQKALIEGMIRVWALRRLPGFLEQFEVLEVEREDQFPLQAKGSDWFRCNGCHSGTNVPDSSCCGKLMEKQESGQQEIVWMSRADGLLRERASGDLYVLSFKTSADWNDFKDKEARIDMQGMSELYAVEQRLRDEFTKDYGVDAEYADAYPKLAGVQMEFLLKGRRSRDKETKQYLQDSILVRPYFKDGGGLIEDEYAWKYWTHCEGPHVMSGGKKCNGDANHSLGKGWYRVPIWEHMPIKEWIQMLHEGGVQSDAGDALEGLVVSPMPFFRHQEEIESWRRQVEGQETRVAEAVEGIKGRTESKYSSRMSLSNYLDLQFPQHREACFKYGEKHSCVFMDCCFGNIGDPLESGLFQLRKAHHAAEAEAFNDA